MPVIAGFNRQIPTEILNVEVLQPPCLSLLLESFKFPLKQFFSMQLHVGVTAVSLSG